MKLGITVLILSLAGLAFCEKQPFERYQSIIDRQMFGMPPPGFDPTKPPNEVSRLSKAEERELTQEQEKLQSAIHFSVIRVSPEGFTQVGFTDNSDPKAPRNYFLKVGETQDGWTVKEADAAEETMTIAKDDIEVSLKIGDNSGKGGGTTAKAGAGDAAGRPAGPRGGLLGGLRGGGDRPMSLRARREMREQQAQAAKAAADQKAAEKEAERQAQAEQEKAEREAERAQQRQQLMAIQEELRKAREARQNAPKAEGGDEGDQPQ